MKPPQKIWAWRKRKGQSLQLATALTTTSASFLISRLTCHQMFPLHRRSGRLSMFFWGKFPKNLFSKVFKSISLAEFFQIGGEAKLNSSCRDIVAMLCKLWKQCCVETMLFHKSSEPLLIVYFLLFKNLILINNSVCRRLHLHSWSRHSHLCCHRHSHQPVAIRSSSTRPNVSSQLLTQVQATFQPF